jgi:hypothetical protein
MTSDTAPSFIPGWLLVTIGIVGLLALAFLALFFTSGGPFGTLNDIFIALTAILTAILAWMLYAHLKIQAPVLSLIGLILAIAGAALVVTGSVLVIFGFTSWFLAGLYMAAGNALIGLWLLQVMDALRPDNPLPRWLGFIAIAVAITMALGLAAFPGIINRIDDPRGAMSVLSYAGQFGALGYLVLYPLWCVLAGRSLMTK